MRRGALLAVQATRVASVITVAIALASCTALPPPQAWFDKRTAPVRIAPLAAATTERKAIEKLTWGEALVLARESSPTVRAARERIARARAVVREARALAFPRLDVRGSTIRFVEAATFRGRSSSNFSDESTRSRFFTGAGSDIYSARLEATYPLFDGGSAYYSRKSVAAALDATEHDARAVLEELELQVSIAFLNVLLAEGAVRIAGDAHRFTAGQETQARAREEAGEGLRIDTLRFATRVSEEQLVLNQARVRRRVQLAVLAELLGLALGAGVELIRPERELELPGGDLVVMALRERPELRALRQRFFQTRHRLSGEKARWWPAIDLFGSYGVISLDNLHLSDQDDELQFGGALTMNLLEGGATSARVDRLRHELGELESQTRELALAIEREVVQYRAELDLSRRNVEVSQKTVELAEEVLERVSARYRAGEAQVLDVNEAELQRTRGQLALLGSQVNLLASQARLRRAIGLRTMEPPREEAPPERTQSPRR